MGSLEKDFNFCFPVTTLENDNVRLEPFEPYVHSERYWEKLSLHPETYACNPWGPFSSIKEFNQWHEDFIEKNESNLLYAIINKRASSPDDEVAGIVAYLDGKPEWFTIEIACLVVLPEFQRKHLATHAVGLLLQYALDPAPTGLGLRRVQYHSHAGNAASIRTAQLLGFTLEGITKWAGVVPIGKTGNGRKGTEVYNKDGVLIGTSVDLAYLALCWDEWPTQRKLVENRLRTV